jgi:hypothetical protein
MRTRMATLKVKIEGKVTMRDEESGRKIGSFPIEFTVETDDLEELFDMGHITVLSERSLRMECEPAHQMFLTVPTEVVTEKLAERAIDEMRSIL